MVDAAEDNTLDAALRIAFGPQNDVTAMRGGDSVLHELEPLTGQSDPVSLRHEQSERDEQLMADLAARSTDRSRYDILGEIARGGMGVILRGRDRDLGRDVAIKILQTRHADDPAMIRRFVEEAQIAGQLQHPGILQVYDLGLREDRRPFFTMKLIRGETLSQLLAARGDASEDRRRFLGVFESICQTMAFAHARGVVHRDLKPANVMVGHFGEVQVVDWGLAKLVGEDAPAPRPGVTAGDGDTESTIRTARSEDPSSQSMCGSVMGTPGYMSPEQAGGDVDTLDERTDVFALGAMLCEILTGRPPYAGSGSEALAWAREGRLADAHRRLESSGVDDELIELARSCLASAPERRPRDARVVADAVTTHLASVEERARASELAVAEARAKAAEERRARRLTMALAAAGVVVIALGGGIFGKVQLDRARDAEQRLADSRQLLAKVRESATLLEAARQAPVDDRASWIALRQTGAYLQALQQSGDISPEAKQETDAFLDELADADRARRVVERIEATVIRYAPHYEKESWTHMVDELDLAFFDFGINLVDMPKTEIAARIRESEFAAQLTDGVELWLAANQDLGAFGTTMHVVSFRQDWLQTLDDADPDPYRTAVRGQVWSLRPDLDVLRELAASEQFDAAPPRTQSWLASTLAAAGDSDAMVDVFFRAVKLNAGDFMLNFDFAFHLESLDRWDGAIRYYHAALATRAGNAGVWRRLGRAYVEIGEHDEALAALRQSILHQDDYPHTHLDLGLALETAGDRAAAIDAYHAAIELAPDLAIAHGRLGLALQVDGRLDDALAALERCHELSASETHWPYPSEQWLEACRNAVERAR